MASKLESLREDGHTIIKVLNYNPNDFETIVSRLNIHFDKKVRFVLPPGGEYHYNFSPVRKWSYLGVKSLDGQSLEKHNFTWGQQFSLGVPKYNKVVAGLSWTRVIVQVDSLQGMRSSIIGHVVPEYPPRSSEIDDETAHLTRVILTEVLKHPIVVEKKWQDAHHISVRWSNQKGFCIMVNMDRLTTLEAAVWEIFEQDKIKFSENILDEVAKIGNEDDNSRRIANLHESREAIIAEEDAKGAIIFNLSDEVTSIEVKQGLKKAYEELWALSEGTIRRQGITLPPKFNTDLIEVDMHVGELFGRPNTMAFFTVNDISVFNVPPEYFPLGLVNNRGDKAVMRKKDKSKKGSNSGKDKSTTKSNKDKGKGKGKQKASLGAYASPNKRKISEVQTEEDDVPEAVEDQGDEEDFTSAAKVDASPQANQSDISLEEMQKRFKILSAQTPVTLKQVQEIVTSSMKPLENNLQLMRESLTEVTKTQIQARKVWLEIMKSCKEKLADSSVSEEAKQAAVSSLDSMPGMTDEMKANMTKLLQEALEQQAKAKAAEAVAIVESMEMQVLQQQDTLIKSQADAIAKINEAMGAGTAKQLLMEDGQELNTPPEDVGPSGGTSRKVSFAIDSAEGLMNVRMAPLAGGGSSSAGQSSPRTSTV